VVRFLSWLVTTALALAVATLVVDGIYFDGPVHGQTSASTSPGSGPPWPGRS
jgi:hypothetical protein